MLARAFRLPRRCTARALFGLEKLGYDGVPALHQAGQSWQSLPVNAPAAAYNAMSGGLHASALAALLQGANQLRATPFRYLRNTLNATERAGSSGSGAQPAWAQVQGSSQTLQGNDNTARTTQRSNGLMMGANHAVGAGKLNLMLGGAYSWHNVASERRIAVP